VVRGEPGVGKTALLRHAIDGAGDMRICRATGVESEIELPFAGLHQLCAPLLGALARLPEPQQRALEIAFGRRSGPPPDRFFVGLAMLSLLSDAARERPLLCVVDDAQWLDWVSAQALAFVARRLQAESVVFIVSTRSAAGPDDLSGLPEMLLEGLAPADARELLASVIPGRLDERVRERIVAETRGNPLALLELPKASTPAELAGGYGLPLYGSIEESFLHRVAQLPHETQRLLLVGAAEPSGDPTLLWRAAAGLGIGARAAEAAELEGLLVVGAQVRFRHPLVRSAVYRAASPDDRRRAHRALAAATDPQTDPDRRAWHRAQAATGPDEEVAHELERSAERARSRGGLAAAAAFLERAAALTVDPERRAERALAAAEATHQAGAPEAALALLATAGIGAPDALLRARADRLRAQIAFSVSRGSDAPPLLLGAARTLEPLDARLARETYLDALVAAMFAGELGGGGGLRDAAAAARAAPRAPDQPSAADLLLDGLAVRIADGYAAGAQPVRRALAAFADGRATDEEVRRWHWVTSHAAHDLWDDATWSALSLRHLQLIRDECVLTELPLALIARLYIHLHAGELTIAASLVEETEAVVHATGGSLAPYGALELAAYAGDEQRFAELIAARMPEITTRGEGMGVTLVQNAEALLYNALGRYGDALTAARDTLQHTEELTTLTWALPELIEAAARSDDRPFALLALEHLAESTRASGTEWALGIEARCRAIVSDGEAAERSHREAIHRLGRTLVRMELARAHLLYGEWLRRRRRRVDAREQLRTAHRMFVAMGAEAFVRRAERELRATGETARRRDEGTRDQLTPQEAQIARLARDGLSNPEIGARLFISPRTVEYHLRKVFSKLGIGARSQLEAALPSEQREPQPA